MTNVKQLGTYARLGPLVWLSVLLALIGGFETAHAQTDSAEQAQVSFEAQPEETFEEGELPAEVREDEAGEVGPEQRPLGDVNAERTSSNFDSFRPSEDISEDFSVPFPTDI